jgi:hypothetical protein
MIALSVLATAAALVLAGVQPQLAASDGVVYLVFGRGDTIGVARSADAGTTFGQPSLLPTSGKLALGMRRGPRIAAAGRVVLVSAVLGTRGGGADGDVMLFRSTNGGDTWGSPTVINDVPGSAREGMHAMAASPSGLAVIAWLDLRERGTRIYAAVSRDHGATWTPDALVYASPSGSVCECCHPSVAIGADGRVAIMFRNNLAGHRDMYVVWSGDGRTFTPAAKLGSGSWALDACPMDGGSVIARADGVVAVWRREGEVFLSTPATPEQRLGSGRDAVVAELDGHREVAWSSPAGVVIQRGSAAPIVLGPGRFPTLLTLRNRSVIAWDDKGSIALRALPR